MASRLDLPQTYTDGIVHGFVEVIKPPAAASVVTSALRAMNEAFLGHAVPEIDRCYNKVVLHATTNGKTWSYALQPHYQAAPSSLKWISARLYVPKDLLPSLRAYRSRTSLGNPYRELVEWAIKDMAKRAKIDPGQPGALQMGVAYDREAPAEVGAHRQGPCGPITYTGYKATTGKYTLDDIHAIVADAIVAGTAVWAWQGDRGTWKPSNLEVMLHSGKQAMGLAFAPGTGHERNKRTISLNEILFRLYDRESIWRVVIHELCHHYRDEVFAPRDTDLATAERLRQAVAEHSAKGYRIKVETLGTHDSVFVRELARVDPKVAADPYAGICFNEYADPSLVADAKAASEAKTAKREAAIDWRPEAGRLWVNRLKDGTFSLYWISLAEGGFKVKIGLLGNAVMTQFINKLGAGAGGDSAPDMPQRVMNTAVTYSETWPIHWSKPDKLFGFIQFCDNTLGLVIMRSKT